MECFDELFAAVASVLTDWFKGRFDKALKGSVFDRKWLINVLSFILSLTIVLAAAAILAFAVNKVYRWLK